VINIIEWMYGLGIEGVILGCTELPMLIRSREVALPIFDSMEIFMDEVVYEYLENR